MPLSKAASNFIDFFRWTGALQVVLIHAGNVFINNADIMTAPHAAFDYIWWFFVAYGYGRQGLMMFFVFSGLLVGGAVIERMKRGDVFLQKYLVDRLIRIHIVLLPVVVIGFVLDEVGRHTFASPGVYDLFASTYDWRLLFPPLAALQGIFFPSYGSNEALWSLGVECWYYITFPLMLFYLAVGYSRAWRIAAPIAGVAIFALLASSGSYFAWGFLPWALGAVAAVMPRPLIRSRWISAGLLIAVATAMRLAIPADTFQTFPWEVFTDCAAALLTANLLLTLRFDESEGFWVTTLPLHKFFSAFSYSLYAIHTPILVICCGIAGYFAGPAWYRELATPAHYMTAIGATALAMGCAYLLSLVTERRTAPVRRFFDRLLAGGKEVRQPQRTAV